MKKIYIIDNYTNMAFNSSFYYKINALISTCVCMTLNFKINLFIAKIAYTKNIS